MQAMRNNFADLNEQEGKRNKCTRG